MNSQPVPSSAAEPYDSAEAHPGDGGRSLMFWLLVLLGVAVFAPCMILPAWREYQAAELTARIRAQQVAELREQVQVQQQHLEALRSDPAVVSRLAQRELELRVPGRTALPVSVGRSDEEASVGVQFAGQSMVDRTTEPPAPIQPPVVLARLGRYLPSWNYDAVFCRYPTREILLALSIALLLAAFVIFWPRDCTA